jgi:hypothetical protein
MERQPGVAGFCFCAFCVGCISAKAELGDFEMSYLRKSLSFEGFVFPDVPDVASSATASED